jgi:hypothetical protein
VSSLFWPAFVVETLLRVTSREDDSGLPQLHVDALSGCFTCIHKTNDPHARCVQLLLLLPARPTARCQLLCCLPVSVLSIGVCT